MLRWRTRDGDAHPAGSDVIDFGGVSDSAGDGVWWGQAAAEPRPLVDALIAQSPRIGPIRTFTGLSWNDQLAVTMPSRVSMVSYGGLGELRELSRSGRLEVVPCPLLGASSDVRRAPAAVRRRPAAGVAARRGRAGARWASVSTTSRTRCGTRRCSLPRSTRECQSRWAPHGFRSTGSPPPSPPTGRCPKIPPAHRVLPSSASPPTSPSSSTTVTRCSWGSARWARRCSTRWPSTQDLGFHTGMVTDGLLRLVDKGVVTGSRKEIDPGLIVAGTALGSAELYNRVPELPARVPADQLHP